MVQLEEITRDGETWIKIYDDQYEVSLQVRYPLTGKHATPFSEIKDAPEVSAWTRHSKDPANVLFLSSPWHSQKPTDGKKFLSLGRRIISGDACWGSSLKLSGEFSYTQFYWEWCEDVLGRSHGLLHNAGLYQAVFSSLFTYDRKNDVFRSLCEAWCSETNSFLTSVGEISITLWDLYMIAGLPIVGRIYDEVIPHADELLQRSSSDVPDSCQYLFFAYHNILKGDVRKKKCLKLEDWISFWFEGVQKYEKPCFKSSNKTRRPASTGNPSGKVSSLSDWSQKTSGAFKSLRIPDGLREEVYLAAFISCWLCSFALPGKFGTFIRPETFKPACLMASGEKVGLAIPVLAMIYRGLNEISKSSSIGVLKFPFPAHYLHAWTALYFNTHFPLESLNYGALMNAFSGEGGAKNLSNKEARNVIHKGDVISWNPVSFTNKRSWTIYDDMKLKDSHFAYLVSIRPSFLTLRSGNYFIVESYCPHRFSRQFGYCQSIPFDLANEDIRLASLADGLKYWRLCTLRNTRTKVIMPPAPSCFKKHKTRSFIIWWEKVHGDYLLVNQNILLGNIQKEVHVPPANQAAVVPHRTVKIKPLMNVQGNCNRPGKQLICPDKSNSVSGKTPNFKHRKQASISDLLDVHLEMDGLSDASIFLISSEEFAQRMNILDEEIFGDEIDSQGSVDSVPSATPSIRIHNKRKASDHDQADVSVAGKSGEDHSSKKSVSLPKATQPIIAPSCMSTWNDDIEISRSRRVCLDFLWESITKKLSRCDFETVHLIREDVEKIFREMEHYKSSEISSLKDRISDYFKSVELYNSQKSTQGSHSTLVEQKEKELAAMISKISGDNNGLEDSEAKLAMIEREREILISSIMEAKNEQQRSEIAKSALEEEIFTLQSQTRKDDLGGDFLVTIEQTLKADRQDLIDFRFSHSA